MDQRMRNDLDNHITGHYGEDQFKEPSPSRNTDATRTISHELVLAWEAIERHLNTAYGHSDPDVQSDSIEMQSAMDAIIAGFTPGYNAESNPLWPEEYDEDDQPTDAALREVEYLPAD